MERLLLLSLRILQNANAVTPQNAAVQERILALCAQRDALLAATPGKPQQVAERAQWELVRYLNKISQAKIAAKL